MEASVCGIEGKTIFLGSKPTGWDGDDLFNFEEGRFLRVLSPLGGMVTEKEEKHHDDAGHVLSSPCGMMTFQVLQSCFTPLLF